MRRHPDASCASHRRALTRWPLGVALLLAFSIAAPGIADDETTAAVNEMAVGDPTAVTADPEQPAPADDATSVAQVIGPTTPGVGEEPAEEKAEGEWASEAEAALGWQGWSVDGNQRRWRQYITPDRGLYPYRILLHARDAQLEDWLMLDLHSISEPGRRFRLVYDDTKDFHSLWGEYRRSEFFHVFEPGFGEVVRDDFTAEGHFELGRDAVLGLDLFTVSANGPGEDMPIHFSATTVTATPQVEIGDLHLRTAFTSEAFNPLRGTFQTGEQRSVLVSLLPAYDHRHMLEGSFSSTWTDLDNFHQDVRTQSAVLELTSLLTRNLVFEGRAYDHRVLDTITANSLEVKRTGGSGVLHYTGLPGVWVEAGADVASVDYLERFQTRVDEPTVANMWARAHYRPSADLKLYGEWRKRNINDTPLPTLGGLVPGPPVLWNDVERWEGKVSYSPSYRFNVTGRFRSEQWVNEGQRALSEARMAEASAWWMPSQKLTLYGTYQRLDWDINGVDGPIFFEFDYKSNANLYTAGASYQVTPKDYVNCATTHSNVLGASRSRYTYLTASWRHDWKPDCGFEANFLIDQFHEAPSAGLLDYEADLFGGRLWHTF
jgi:hypothetical protein